MYTQDGFPTAGIRVVKAQRARRIPPRFPSVPQLTELTFFLSQFQPA